MDTFNEKAKEFLAQKRIAVAGVSRDSNQTANTIYKTLRKNGYLVYPVNPKTSEAEGDKCYPDLKSIPEKVDGVIAITKPEQSYQLAMECAEVGIPRLWMHENAFAGASATSVSQDAVDFCNKNKIMVIQGGCPLMFLEFGHRCMRYIFSMMGKLPE